MLIRIDEDEGHINKDEGQTFDNVDVNRTETEGRCEDGVLYDINEEKDQSNEDDEGHIFDRVGVNLPTVLLYGLMRCSACDDGLGMQADIPRTAR